MERWPIERSWTLLKSDGAREKVLGKVLPVYRACWMLGAAGLGKTCELNYLADLDRQRGYDVRWERLAELGQTPEGLLSNLTRLAGGATQTTALYLDALDEVMVPVGTAGLMVGRWVRERLSANRPALRISCRSTVWPLGLEAAIRETYGKNDCACALLEPLSPEDVRSIACDAGVDADAFAKALESESALVLSSQPLTLKMLLKEFMAAKGFLPSRRNDLFERGLEHLASERYERVEAGTALDVSLADLLDAAEHLACFCLLSGRDIIDLGDSPLSSALGTLELERLPSGTNRLDRKLVLAVG